MSTLRVTSGTLRGRRVAVPRDDVRPTSERARQAYFNIVGQRVVGARFLDLFAGSGIFSFEALSRGAAEAVAVDSSRANVIAIEKNARTFGVEVTTIAADVLLALDRLGDQPFDLVYADPPYAYGHYEELVTSLERIPFAADAIVAIEHRRGSDPFSAARTRRLELWRRAEYGEVWITLFRTATG